jgi:hypothetical protein
MHITSPGREGRMLEVLSKGQSDLISPVSYNESSKESFFNSVWEWSVARGTEIGEITIDGDLLDNVGDMVDTTIEAYRDLFYPRDDLREHGMKARIDSCISKLSQAATLPLTGRWSYYPDEREIIRGTEAQRYCNFAQGDPLVRMYLHAYQHLLYDHLKQEGLIRKEHPRPSGIVKPRQWGFQLKPPSKDHLKAFENKVIDRIIKYQSPKIKFKFGEPAA